MSGSVLLQADALESVSDDELEDVLLDRPISSIRELQYTYGRLFELAVMDSESPASRYRTFEDNKLVGENRFIEVIVNPEGEDGIDVVGVKVKKYTSDVANKVALCHNTAARGCDNSLTQISSKSGWGDDTIENFVGKFEQWTNQDTVDEALHSDELTGFNKTVAESLLNIDWDELEDEMEERLDGVLDSDLTSDQLIASISFYDDTESETRYAGEIDVCFEALKQKKYAEYTETSINAGEPSVGRGTCYVTGESNVELMGTMNDPLKHFVSKQQSTFPDILNNNSWMAHPISFDAAMAIDNSGVFMEKLRTRTNEMFVYHLPYPEGVPTVRDLRDLYGKLQTIFQKYEQEENGDDSSVFDGDDAFGEMYNNEYDGYNVYILFEDYQQSSRRNIFFEETHGSTYLPKKLATIHRDVVREADNSEIILTKVGSEKESVFSDNDTLLLKQILGGWYFNQTMPDYYDDSPNASDPVAKIMQTILANDTIDVSILLQEYDRAICNEWNEQARNDDGADRSRVPAVLLSQQALQLEALARAGLLHADQNQQTGYTQQSTNMTEQYDTEQMIDTLTEGEKSKGEQISLKKKTDLMNYLDNRPQYDDPERRATFVMGAFIGFVSSDQTRQNKRGIADTIALHQLNKRQLQNIVTKAIEKNKVYSHERGSTIWHQDLITVIQDNLYNIPTEWDISTEDMRFTFAQGLMYGENYYHDLEYNDQNTLETVNNEPVSN